MKTIIQNKKVKFSLIIFFLTIFAVAIFWWWRDRDMEKSISLDKKCETNSDCHITCCGCLNHKDAIRCSKSCSFAILEVRCECVEGQCIVPKLTD